jgi:outer membrane lipoprotein SlyB
MMKKKSISVAIGLLLAICLLGCQNSGNKIGVDEKEIQGFKTKTFFNDNENIEVTIASDGKSTIVAVPKTAISRRNQMGDDEYKCLKACKDIADLESRLNCILLCPVTNQYQVFIY